VQDRRIWLIGGTQESRELAIALSQAQIPSIVSVTTTTARLLYPESPWLEVIVGRLEQSQILNLIQTAGIGGILDASHPFAIAISQAAMAISQQTHIPYLRFERPEVKSPPEPGSTVIELDHFSQVLSDNYLLDRRVLLTVGYQPLAQFSPWQQRATLYARILPSPIALAAALAAGFGSDRLLALRPPISPELEAALWRHWQIDRVIAKASGQPGGEQTKRSLAKALGVELILIGRPQIDYPQQTQDLGAALRFCAQSLNSSF
jgi:precorrin-6A/cobalt-precorrin-6A reductase